MSFKEDHPRYKTYKKPSYLHFHDVPYSAWSELESLIVEAGGDDKSTLAAVVINVAMIARAGNVDANLAYQYIPDVVSALRHKVDGGKFILFMDSLGILCDEGNLNVDTLNEYLEDNNIGYRAYKSMWTNGIVWEKVEDECSKDVDDDIESDEENALLPLKSDCAEIVTSNEQLIKEQAKMKVNGSIRDEIFISHRTVDSVFADMVLDYLVGCEIPRNIIFCSSLPGNDVDEKISPEVKYHLKKAAIIILILSKDYYESVYCMNEAGVAWYLDDEVSSIPIGLPEINHKGMVGFFDQVYKLRRLDNDDDIAFIFDITQEKINVGTNKHSIITRETTKLKGRYKLQIKGRINTTSNTKVDEGDVYELGDQDAISDNPIVQIIIEAGGSVSGVEHIISASHLSQKAAMRKIKEAIEDGEIEVIGDGKKRIYRVRIT